MKWDYGLFSGEGGSRRAQIASVLTDPGPRHLEEEAAQRSLVLLRDRARLLPLSRGKKILLVEDIATIQLAINDRWCHPGMMWEAMLEHDPGVMMVEYSRSTPEPDWQRVEARMPEAELIVLTHYYERGIKDDLSLPLKVLVAGKPVVLVTNTPFELAVPDGFPTVMVTYSVTRESLRAAAALLFGKA